MKNKHNMKGGITDNEFNVMLDNDNLKEEDIQMILDEHHKSPNAQAEATANQPVIFNQPPPPPQPATLAGRMAALLPSALPWNARPTTKPYQRESIIDDMLLVNNQLQQQHIQQNNRQEQKHNKKLKEQEERHNAALKREAAKNNKKINMPFELLALHPLLIFN